MLVLVALAVAVKTIVYDPDQQSGPNPRLGEA